MSPRADAASSVLCASSSRCCSRRASICKDSARAKPSTSTGPKTWPWPSGFSRLMAEPVLGIYREERFSPGKEQDDRAILDAAARALRSAGLAVDLLHGDRLPRLGRTPELIFAMCQSPEALAWLAQASPPPANAPAHLRHVSEPRGALLARRGFPANRRRQFSRFDPRMLPGESRRQARTRGHRAAAVGARRRAIYDRPGGGPLVETRGCACD